jgi:hypothetical protein
MGDLFTFRVRFGVLGRPSPDQHPANAKRKHQVAFFSSLILIPSI